MKTSPRRTRALGKANGSLNRDALTNREREVMLLAAKGFANKTIARELNVTEGTVKLHLHRIYQKLGVRSRFALTAVVVKTSKPQTRMIDSSPRTTVRRAGVSTTKSIRTSRVSGGSE